MSHNHSFLPRKFFSVRRRNRYMCMDVITVMMSNICVNLRIFSGGDGWGGEQGM